MNLKIGTDSLDGSSISVTFGVQTGKEGLLYASLRETFVSDSSILPCNYHYCNVSHFKNIAE
jgi:hypothetical protein